jgi:hypothetical protein
MRRHFGGKIARARRLNIEDGELTDARGEEREGDCSGRPACTHLHHATLLRVGHVGAERLTVT